MTIGDYSDSPETDEDRTGSFEGKSLHLISLVMDSFPVISRILAVEGRKR